LVAKVREAAAANMSLRRRPAPVKAEPHMLAFNPKNGVSRNIIAIGSSTGGVEALRDIFMTLPANCPPIVMTQHMPQHFTPSFAARLDSLSQVVVAEATHGARLLPGHAYLAPGSRHLKIAKSAGELVCQLDDAPPVSSHRPSVDVLFDSVAKTVGAGAVGVILTGMGKDGAQGMLHMHEQGAYTVGQNQTSCVVYGMPKAAAALGAIDKELPLSDIAAHVLSYCERERKDDHVA
jgi:two-component system chemotaxis response regulator CheB